MKKYIVAYLSLSFFIGACSSDNSETNLPQNSVVTDIDGTDYPIVDICEQVYMKRNLQVSHYSNGDPIPHVTDPVEWRNLSTGAWCYYNNDPSTEETYGKLYNWYAVNDPRGLAPSGWHVPSYDELTILIEDCLGGYVIAGGKLKEEGTIHWDSPNAAATNSSGFTGLPGGYRTFSGSFNYLREMGYFWTSTEFDESESYFLALHGLVSNATRNSNRKYYGFSVRCIKD